MRENNHNNKNKGRSVHRLRFVIASLRNFVKTATTSNFQCATCTCKKEEMRLSIGNIDRLD